MHGSFDCPLIIINSNKWELVCKAKALQYVDHPTSFLLSSSHLRSNDFV